jgi:hypothetical protein
MNMPSSRSLQGVVGTGTMGKTNPTQPVTDTKVDQESMSRLLTLNSIDVR